MAGVESRAPEVYATPEVWEVARDTFAEGLRAVWDGADVALRKQYASRFTTYRAAMLRAWESQHAKPAKRQPGTPDKPTLTPDGRILYEAWCSLFHVAIPEHPSIVTTANELYQPISKWADRLHWTQADVLKDIMNRAYENDKERGYYKGRGVKLFNIKHEIEGWQSAMERKLQAERRAAATQNGQRPARPQEAPNVQTLPVLAPLRTHGGRR